MLSQQALDWWFSPWLYAPETEGYFPGAADRLGQRDGYRIWCSNAGLVADIPAEGEPRWEVAFTTSGEELVGAARLFRGLTLARQHDYDKMTALSIFDRKWCCSIASTQPLYPAWHGGQGRQEALDIEGLVDLALRLEHGFPGAWQRLRLTLPAPAAARIDALKQHVGADSAALAASATRAQRCWRLCRARAAAQYS